MRKLKSVVSALLLTVLLIGLALLNGAELFADPNSGMGECQVTYAKAGKFPEIRIKKPTYNDEGDLVGCSDKGNGCVIIVMFAGGQQHELLITAQDILLR